MVDLGDDGGPTVGQAVDDGELPQRAGAVEALHADRFGEVEHVAPRTVAGRSHPAEVVVEVEVRIDLPPGRGDRHRVTEHPLAQPGHQPADAVHAAAEQGAIRHAVEHEDRGDRAAEQRILLDAPHERVAVAHAGLELEVDGVVGHHEPPIVSR